MGEWVEETVPGVRLWWWWRERTDGGGKGTGWEGTGVWDQAAGVQDTRSLRPGEPPTPYLSSPPSHSSSSSAHLSSISFSVLVLTFAVSFLALPNDYFPSHPPPLPLSLSILLFVFSHPPQSSFLHLLLRPSPSSFLYFADGLFP